MLYEVITRGNVALLTSAMLTYRIRDLQRWGIENKSPQTLLQNDFDGIVKDIMQGRNVDELIRITSYNVCYTKLLRSPSPRPGRS